MNGKKNLPESSNDYARLVDNLEDYINNKSIEVTEVNYEVRDILNLTEAGLRDLTEQECLEKSFCLTGYCDYIHILHTKEQIKLDWCNNALSKMMSEYQYPQYTKWELKLPILISNNETARTISEAKGVAKSRVDMLKEKISYMQDQVDVLKKLAYVKRNRR
tara:strand:- start:1024 stop:1509 length:486 start_codon:yes stop_codon:yes gene_type:complete